MIKTVLIKIKMNTWSLNETFKPCTNSYLLFMHDITEYITQIKIFNLLWWKLFNLSSNTELIGWWNCYAHTHKFKVGKYCMVPKAGMWKETISITWFLLTKSFSMAGAPAVTYGGKDDYRYFMVTSVVNLRNLRQL